MDVNWYAVIVVLSVVLAIGKGLWAVARWGKGVDVSIANINEKVTNLADKFDKVYNMFTAFLGREVTKSASPISLFELCAGTSPLHHATTNCI